MNALLIIAIIIAVLSVINGIISFNPHAGNVNAAGVIALILTIGGSIYAIVERQFWYIAIFVAIFFVVRWIAQAIAFKVRANSLGFSFNEANQLAEVETRVQKLEKELQEAHRQGHPVMDLMMQLDTAMQYREALKDEIAKKQIGQQENPPINGNKTKTVVITVIVAICAFVGGAATHGVLTDTPIIPAIHTNANTAYNTNSSAWDTPVTIIVPGTIIRQDGYIFTKLGAMGGDLEKLTQQEGWTNAYIDKGGFLVISTTRENCGYLRELCREGFVDMRNGMLDRNDSTHYIPLLRNVTVDDDFSSITYYVDGNRYWNGFTKDTAARMSHYACYYMSYYQLYNDVPTYSGTVTIRDSETDAILNVFDWPYDSAFRVWGK